MEIEKEASKANSAWLALAYAQLASDYPNHDIQSVDFNPGTLEFCALKLIHDSFSTVSDSHKKSRITSLTGMKTPEGVQRLHKLLQAIIHQELRDDHPIGLFDPGFQDSLTVAILTFPSEPLDLQRNLLTGLTWLEQPFTSQAVAMSVVCLLHLFIIHSTRVTF